MQLPLLAPPRASAVQGQACFMAAVDAHIYLSTTYRATEQQVTLWGSLFKSRLSSGETFYPGQVRAAARWRVVAQLGVVVMPPVYGFAVSL